jgi:hypothetical protein
MNKSVIDKKVIIGIAAVFLITIIYGLAIMIMRVGKVEVQVNSLPQDAQITVNGSTLSQGRNYIEPGEYEVVAIKEGFEEYSNTYTFTIDSEANFIDIALTPDSPEAEQWARGNMQAYMDFEARAGDRAIQEGLAVESRYPIVRHLPFSNLLYSIGHQVDPEDEDNIIVRINAPIGYRELALQQIRNWGIDPTPYTINFNNHDNPFDRYE